MVTRRGGGRPQEWMVEQGETKQRERKKLAKAQPGKDTASPTGTTGKAQPEAQQRAKAE